MHLFQFHKGTIRTDYFTGVLPTSQLFQFHKGTIRTHDKQEQGKGVLSFQFHKGTIRTDFAIPIIDLFTDISIP